MTNKELEFLEKEHKAGFHLIFTEHCYECHRQNRLLKAKKIVDRPSFNKYAHEEAFGRNGQIDDPRFGFNSNPLG